MMTFLRALMAMAVIPVACHAQVAPESPNSATFTYHGVRITDEHAWLTDVQSPTVKKWLKQQNQRIKYYLDRMTALPAIRIWSDNLSKDAQPFTEKVAHENGVTVAVVNRNLVIMRSWEDLDAVQVLVDTDSYFPGHEAHIASLSLSADGRRVAVGVTKDGTEEGELVVFDTLDGEQLPERLKRVFAPQGGAVAWMPDGSGFYYTYFPDADPKTGLSPKRYAQQELRFHTMGQPVRKDKTIFGRDLPPFATLGARVSPDGRRTLMSANLGYMTDTTQWYLRDTDGKIRLIADFADRWLAADFGPGDTLIIESHLHAPRGKLIQIPLSDLKTATPKLIVPEGSANIGDLLHSDTRYFVTDRDGKREHLRVFDFDGKEQSPVPIPPFVAIQELTHLNRDRVVFRCEGYVVPPSWYLYDAADHSMTRLGISGPVRTPTDDLEVIVEEARSADGTPVPLTIICKKGTARDGERPVFLTAYGGFRETNRPDHHADRRIWLDQGGIWVIAEPRGDGCNGDDWHEAAIRVNKRRTIDDFIAVTEHLIARKYTKPARIAIHGGSNGGLTLGGAIVRRPDLFAAAVMDCGVYDLLRFERDFTGACYAPEYGSVTKLDEFKAMHALSPYHNLKDGVKYPAVWIRTGMNDRRLHPAHSYAFAARMQSLKPPKAGRDGKEADESSAMILLSAHPDEGHEFEPSTEEMLAFMLSALEVPFQAPAEGK